MTILIVLTLVVALVSVLGAYLTAVVVAAGELRRANTHSHAQVPDGPDRQGVPTPAARTADPCQAKRRSTQRRLRRNRWGSTKSEIS